MRSLQKKKKSKPAVFPKDSIRATLKEIQTLTNISDEALELIIVELSNSFNDKISLQYCEYLKSQYSIIHRLLKIRAHTEPGFHINVKLFNDKEQLLRHLTAKSIKASTQMIREQLIAAVVFAAAALILPISFFYFLPILLVITINLSLAVFTLINSYQREREAQHNFKTALHWKNDLFTQIEAKLIEIDDTFCNEGTWYSFKNQ